MKDRYITIAGVRLDLILEMEDNVRKLESSLIEKQSFAYLLQKTIDKVSIRKSNFNFINKLFIMIGLLPNYIMFQFQENKRLKNIESAISILKDKYRQPSTILLRSKLQCKDSIQSYVKEKNIILLELSRLEKDLELTDSDASIRLEIVSLIKDYNKRLSQKESKLKFYEECLEKISALETKMSVIRNVEVSKERIKDLDSLENQESNAKREELLRNEVKLYEEYGTLLNNISDNISRISKDKNEEILALELKSIVEKIII